MRKAKQRWDYKTLNNTGVKILKAKPARMTLTVEQELKVVKKIDRFLEENDKLDLFFDADELYEAIRECREILQEYEEIHVELQNELHDDYEGKYKYFSEIRQNLMGWVLNAKEEMRSRKRLALNQNQEQENRRETEALEKIRKDEENLIFSCQSMYSHICDRFADMEQKFKVQWCTLTDAQVLDKQKEFKILEKEYHEILDKVLKFSQSNPGRFQATVGLMPQVMRRKENLKDSLDEHRDFILREVTTRDISEEKIKNASLLGIELPKFSDYSSDLDFYSFKTKFNKLFSHKVQQSLLPEYLKNNYLSGQALQIVKEVYDLEAIWERLEECFGHVPTLMNP